MCVAMQFFLSATERYADYRGVLRWAAVVWDALDFDFDDLPGDVGDWLVPGIWFLWQIHVTMVILSLACAYRLCAIK